MDTKTIFFFELRLKTNIFFLNHLFLISLIYKNILRLEIYFLINFILNFSSTNKTKFAEVLSNLLFLKLIFIDIYIYVYFKLYNNCKLIVENI